MPQEKQKQDINLLPTSELKQRKVNPYVQWFLANFFMVYLVLYVLIALILGVRGYMEFQLNRVNAQIEDHRVTIDENQAFIEEFERTQIRYQQTNDLMTGYIKKGDYLQVIERTIPAPVDIERITIESANLLITASTSDYLSINQWQYDLTQDDAIKSVTISQVERTPLDDESGEAINFTLIVEVN